MRRRVELAGLLLPLFVLSSVAGGCSARTISLGQPGMLSETYGEVRDIWTRSDKAYHQFSMTASAKATYFSQEFTAYYLREYRDIYNPSDSDYSRFEQGVRDRSRNADCFFLSLFTGQRDWNDLDSETSVWNIYVQTPSGKAELVSARQIPPDDLLASHFFPAMGKFDQGYELCFSQGRTPVEQGRALVASGMVPWFELHMMSPAAHLTMRWELTN